ncbi:hypothetical protein E0Z10_g8946 [Xylaria hypoxylon]|uniref:Uncharacterized protein n=1 Tax=Xylaria hypoxylon TaxID=37992 RepID=A0A4Z0Y6Y9_9PEZI|nr:hypothetical protein E0Z10_g8946 [Xylaria hypoxylon]
MDCMCLIYVAGLILVRVISNYLVLEPVVYPIPFLSANRARDTVRDQLYHALHNLPVNVLPPPPEQPEPLDTWQDKVILVTPTPAKTITTPSITSISITTSINCTTTTTRTTDDLVAFTESTKSPTPTKTFTSIRESPDYGEGDLRYECDWLYKYSFGDPPPTPYNILTQVEVSALHGAVLQVRQNSRVIQTGTRDLPEEIPQFNGVTDVMSIFVYAPIQSLCATFFDLIAQFPPETESAAGAAKLMRLIDSALEELPDVGLITPDQVDEYGLDQAGRRVFRLVMGGEDIRKTFCIRNNCDWPIRIFHMWQEALDIRDILKTRLLDVRANERAKVIGKPPLKTIMAEFIQLLPVYFVVVIVAAMLGPAGRAAGRVNLGNDIALAQL